MTLPGWITLAIIAVAAVSIVTGRLRPDLIALFVVLALALTGVLTPAQAFSGFSQSAVITILSIFIMTAGIESSGVTNWLGRRLLRQRDLSERRLIAALTLTAAGISLFMNTVAATAVLLPTSVGIARLTKIRPSRLLMPVAFGSLLGGTGTLLTTANLIVNATLGQSGFPGLGLLDFLPIGLPLTLLGTLILILLAPKILPSRDIAGSIARMSRLHTELAKLYELRQGTCEVRVLPGSVMAGQTLGQGGWGHDLGLTVLGISHQERYNLAPTRDSEIYEGDILLIEGDPSREDLARHGLSLCADSELAEMLASSDYPLVEAVLAPRSDLEGQTLRQIRFRERFSIQLLAFWREGRVLQMGLADIPLRFGDSLLMQGPRERIDLLRSDPNLLILGEEAEMLPSHRAPLAVAILLGCLSLAAVGALPISLATLAGAFAMILSGVIKMDQAYRAIEWKVVFLIAGMLPLSLALQTTGTARLLGRMLASQTDQMGALGAAGLMVIAATTLSIFLGAHAAAIILSPIGISVATLIGSDPRAFAMAVGIGCSLGFVSPLGHPSNLLVMGPGGYTFQDYLRLGAPLMLGSILTTIIGLHYVWGL